MPTPVTPAIIGQAAYWGIPSGTYGAGVVTRVTRDLDGETAFLYDGNGYTISEILYDDKETFTVELVMDAANFTMASLPARGTVITIDGVASCIAQKRGITYEQKGWRTANITAMSFVNVALS
jgi:YD repeat-containing protein